MEGSKREGTSGGTVSEERSVNRGYREAKWSRSMVIIRNTIAILRSPSVPLRGDAERSSKVLHQMRPKEYNPMIHVKSVDG